jgi:hypothetical protein
MEKREDPPQAIWVSGGKQEKVIGKTGQGCAEQGSHKGVWLGERKIEAITPKALQLRHSSEGLLDGLQRQADTPKASPQGRGLFRCGEGWGLRN